MRLLAAAAVLALVAAPAPAILLPAVTVRASSGQAYEGTIVNAGDYHDFLLEDFYPMAVSISLKAGKGSLLLPDITLLDPVSSDITATLAPYRKDGTKSVSVRNAPGFAASGRHILQVKGKTGSTGSYLLKVTAKVTRTFKGTGLVNSPATATFDVLAPTESVVALKVVHGTGSILVPEYVSVTGSSCAVAALVPSLKPGQAAFASPLTFTYAVEVGGAGGTGGSFAWLAKVKPARPSRKPVRVNGGAPFFALEGPAGGILTASAGQDVFGFGVSATNLCWREVKTTGGGPNGNKNSIQCATLKGAKLPSPANNFATDAAPNPRTFAVGPTHAAAFSEGKLFGIPLAGGGADVLNDTLVALDRVLVEGDSAFALRSDGIRRYAFDGSVSMGVSTDAGLTYLDMAVGGLGIVFAAEDGSGDLLIETLDRDGGGLTPLATLSPNPGFFALAARGPDVYFAFDNGTGGASLGRASSCDPGTPFFLCPDFSGPVTAMAADDQDAYAIEDDATDGVRVRQVPRGGGESIVLFRGDGASFTIEDDGIGAAGGYVYVREDGSFYRIKRR